MESEAAFSFGTDRRPIKALYEAFEPDQAKAFWDRIHAKVDWQFTSKDARIRLKRLYPTLEE